MAKTKVDHFGQAVEFLNHGYSSGSFHTIENITRKILGQMDVSKSERILAFSHGQHGDRQKILGIKDKIMLSFTRGTPEIIEPGLRFGKDGIIGGDGKEILPFTGALAGLIEGFKNAIVDPKEVVEKSQSVYPERYRKHLRELDSAHYDYLSRPTNRQCFEFASRQPLDIRGNRSYRGIRRTNGPYFIHFLEAVFPEYIGELLEYGTYYVIFTEHDLFIESPSKKVIRIPANGEYKEIFRFPRTAEAWNKLPPIDSLITHVNAAIEELIHIDPIPLDPTDLVIYPNKGSTQGIWFTENHDCPHIFDEDVVKTLTKILGFFGPSLKEFFPTRMRSLPGEKYARIQILSTKEHFLGTDRFRKPLQDFKYFEEEYLPGKDSWDFPFINTFVEELYTKKGEAGNDKKLIYNILAGIYRHMLIDTSENDGIKGLKWGKHSEGWKKIARGQESFGKSIAHLETSGIYKKGTSEKMIGLGLFLHYGYLTYISYAKTQGSNLVDAKTNQEIDTQLVPPEIKDFFFTLLNIKPHS